MTPALTRKLVQDVARGLDCPELTIDREAWAPRLRRILDLAKTT